jgi:hypothetical protein
VNCSQKDRRHSYGHLSIIERLKAIGWEDELQPEDLMSDGPLSELEEVDRSTELTTQGELRTSRHLYYFELTCLPMLDWESICPPLVKFIEDRKAARLYRERCTSLKSRFMILKKAFHGFRRSHIARGDLRPRVIDVCLDQKVRNLLDAGANNTSTPELREQLLSLFPDICARWRENIESRLLEWASAYIEYRKGVSASELASFVFRCSTCGDVLWYPAVLAHTCLSAALPLRKGSLSIKYEEAVIQICAHNPSIDVLDPTAWSGITNLIQMCGLDPKVATCDQMDQVNARLTCNICNEHGRRKIMTWRTAVSFLSPFYSDLHYRHIYSSIILSVIGAASGIIPQ